jgi:hypothetical protein
MIPSAEELSWNTIDPDHIWVLDKLILSRKSGYVCGPTGLAVPNPDFYIVRPCVNLMGLGLGAQKLWLEGNTDHLPLGFFWCEWFSGRHLSVDYQNGEQVLCVEGFKPDNTFTRWQSWKKTDDAVVFPAILNSFKEKYEYINCEFIGGRLIEVHFRKNEDFAGDINEFIPVWADEIPAPPAGYTYREYPDVHGRIGAYVK